MKVLFRFNGLEVVLFEGEDGYRGLGVVLEQSYRNPRLYLYDPELVRYGGIVEGVLKKLVKGLGSQIEEFLLAEKAFLEHGSLSGKFGLDVVRCLAKILASGVELRPSLSELGRRIGRILKSERKVVLKDGKEVKSYDKLYSFSMVAEIAAAIARLEGCRAIEVRAGVKKERGPDLRVVSDSGEEILIEVTARRPSRHLDTLELPTSLDEFLKKVLEIDLERVRSKIEEQEKQLTQANCIIIAGWHTALGIAPLKHFAKLRSVQKVEELRGICMYSSWISTNGPQNILLCFP